MAKEHQVSHKQMRILRLRSDQLHKEYKKQSEGRTLLKRELEEYLQKLSALVDRACKNSGFASQPVMVNRNQGGLYTIDEIKNKGRVKSR